MMRPLVRAESQDQVARERLALGTVVELLLVLAADAHVAIGVPEVRRLSMTAIALVGLLRASITIQPTRRQFHF